MGTEQRYFLARFDSTSHAASSCVMKSR